MSLRFGAASPSSARATGRDEHFVSAAAHLLMWPTSTLWAVPEGADDAAKINRTESAEYSTFGERLSPESGRG